MNTENNTDVNRPPSSLHSLSPIYNQVSLPAHKNTHFTYPQTYPLYLPTNIPTLPAKHTHFICPQTCPLYLPTDMPTLPAHKHTHFTCPQAYFTCSHTYPLYLATNIPTLPAWIGSVCDLIQSSILTLRTRMKSNNELATQ